jgi:integrase
MGFREQHWASEAIIIKRSDVSKVYNYAYRKYEQSPTKLNLRNFVITRVSRKNGLRNSEIRTLEIEWINFEERSFQVLDSKKHVLSPSLPTDVLTLQFIKDLIGERQRGLLFIHEGSWTRVKADQPLSRVEIWQIVHNIAEEAGVKGFNPRNLRQAFAYEWYKKMREDKRSVKTMKGLQQYLRHAHSKTTDIYIDKMFSFPDLQREFDDDEGIQKSPFQEFEQESANVAGSNPTRVQIPVSLEDCVCKGCSNLALCRSWTQKNSPLPSCVSSCKFKVITQIQNVS